MVGAELELYHSQEQFGAVTIETANSDDVEEIFQLFKTVYVPTYTNVTPELTEEETRQHANNPFLRSRLTDKLNRYIPSNDNGAIFVARSVGKVIGYSTIIIDNDGKHWLDGLYVNPQKKGTGRILLGAALDWHQQHKTQGDNDIYLWVAPKTPAVRFYFNQGFRWSGEYGGSTWESGKHLPLIEMRLPARKGRS